MGYKVRKGAFFSLILIAILSIFLSGGDKSQAERSSSPGSVALQSSNSKSQNLLQTPLKRKLPKRRVSEAVIRAVINSSGKPDALQKVALQIRNQPEANHDDFTFGPTVEWDLSQTPTNDEEYRLALKENQIQVLHAISEAAVSGHLEGLQISSYQYVVLKILEEFQFDRIEEGTGKLVISPKGIGAFAQRFKNPHSQRAVASSDGLLSLQSSVVQQPSFNQAQEEALSAIQDSETVYNAPLPGDKEREKALFVEGDPLSSKSFDLIGWLMNSLTFVKEFGFFGQDFHADNLRLVSDVLEEARENPEKFGYDSKSEIRDVTDIDFPAYARRIVWDKTWKFGVLAGSMSAVFGATIAKFFTESRVFFGIGAFAALGFETLLTAIGVYNGCHSLFFLHRYYSYMAGVKEKARANNQIFIPQEVRKNFDPDSVFEGEAFSMEVRKAWVFSAFIGSLIKAVLTKRLSRKLVMQAAEQIVFGSVHGVGGNVSKIILPHHRLPVAFRNKIYTIVGSQTLEEFLEVAFNGVPKGIQFVKNIPGLKNVTGGLLSVSPVGILTTITDFGLTSVAVGMTIHYKLEGIWKLLNQVHLSPGKSIQLALVSEEVDFQDATRKVLYPLCYYMAVQSRWIEKSTHFGGGETEEQKDVEDRVESCRKIVRNFESEKNSEIYLELFEKSPPTEREFKDLVGSAQDYPSYFQTTWLAALRSIFSLSAVPSLYWKTRNQVILGDRLLRDNKNYSILWRGFEVFTFSDFVPQRYLNLERLTYAVNLVAVDLYRYENKNADGSLIPREEVPSSINAVDGFLAYYRFHHFLAQQAVYELERLAIEEKRDDPWWRRAANAVKEWGENLVADIRYVIQEQKDGDSTKMGRMVIENEVSQVVGQP